MHRYKSVPVSDDQLAFNFGQPDTISQCGALQENHRFAVQYFVDEEEVARKFGHRVSSVHADLIDVAASVYMADRLAKRPRAISRTAAWRRTPTLTVPVRCVSVWGRPEVQKSLADILHFLTGDAWNIRFSPGPDGRRVSETQSFLFSEPFDRPVKVALYSGGLDSLSGLAAALESDSSAHFVCVSAVPNYRHQSSQRRQIKCLKSASGGRITHIRIPCWLHSVNEVKQDPFRRTRGLVFLLFGAVTALSAGTRSLSVYENGVGAINLPYERGQIGIPNSRAVHPRTLSLVSNFVSLVTNQPFQISNPEVLKTKAEMCSGPHLATIAALVAETFSCDRYPIRKRGTPQYGFCTSCLLRRLALHNAGISHLDSADYLHDVQSSSFRATRQRLQGLLAMDWQVERLRACLRTVDPWAALLLEFPDLRIVHDELAVSDRIGNRKAQEGLLRLFRRHCEEWHAFQQRGLAKFPRKVA